LEQFYLEDARWALIASSLPGKEGDPGRHGCDNRLFVEAVLWIVRTGSSWRKLPPQFGHWYTAYTRFNRWSLTNVWPEVFAKLAEDESCEYFYENGAITYAPLGKRRVCRPRSNPVPNTESLAVSYGEKVSSPLSYLNSTSIEPSSSSSAFPSLETSSASSKSIQVRAVEV
jgi:transposase